MKPNIIRAVLMDHALRMKRLHQAHSPKRQANASLQDPFPQLTEFQAAAAQIENEPGWFGIAERPERSDAHQTGFFFAGDDFEVDLGLMTDPFDQNVAVAGLARRTGGHGAIGRHALPVHDPAELAKRGGGVAESLAVKLSRRKSGMAQANGSANGFDNLPVVGGMHARNDQPERVRAGVDRGQVNGFG